MKWSTYNNGNSGLIDPGKYGGGSRLEALG